MNIYKFHSEWGSGTKAFKIDDEAFRHSVKYMGDVTSPSIYKLKGNDWFIWDYEKGRWVYDQKETERSRKETKRNFDLDFGNG